MNNPLRQIEFYRCLSRLCRPPCGKARPYRTDSNPPLPRLRRRCCDYLSGLCRLPCEKARPYRTDSKPISRGCAAVATDSGRR
jgi:hypothetical protein